MQPLRGGLSAGTKSYRLVDMVLTTPNGTTINECSVAARTSGRRKLHTAHWSWNIKFNPVSRARARVIQAYQPVHLNNFNN